jgi:hypothetical protein
VTSDKPRFNLVASEGRLAHLGVEQVDEERAERCEYALCPLASDPEVRKVEGSSEQPCGICGDTVLVHPKDPVRPKKICPPCAKTLFEATEQ